MKLRALLSVAVVALSSAAAFAGTTVKAVRGDLAPTDPAGATAGWFRLVDVERDGATRQGVVVSVRGLDGAADAVYEVVLEKDAQTADLGAMKLWHGATRAFLRYDTKHAPDGGATDLSPFSGGTLHVQLAGADVATATIPTFVEPDGPPSITDAPAPSVAYGYGSVLLGDASAAGTGPVARLVGFAGNGSSGVVQSIGLGGFGFSRGETYSLVLTGASEDVVGTFKASWFGWAGLLVSTRRGDAIPGGSVAGLAGRGVEVRDSSGKAVLSGTFPSLK